VPQLLADHADHLEDVELVEQGFETFEILVPHHQVLQRLQI
jgi:hypothetical protein